MKIKKIRKNVKTQYFASLPLRLIAPLRAICMLLLLCPVVLSAQNGVTVSNLVVATGSPTTVTFNVAWAKPMPVTAWSDTVWVFVDYNKAGKMERLPLTAGATLTETSAPGVGKVEYAENNNKGVWVIGNARSAGNFSATVQLLTATSGVAGACAYASNYPPVGEYESAAHLTFTGTPPYDIVLTHTDGSTTVTQSGGDFYVPSSYTAASFTDKTGAPGKIKCIPMTGDIDFTVTPATIAKGQAVAFAVSGSLSNPSSSAITYIWSAPDFSPASHTGTPFNATVPAVDGNYPVTLTARSTGFCDLTKSKNVMISDCIPPATFTLTASASGFCAGAAGVTFGLSGTENGRNYQLYRGATPVGVLNGTGSAGTFSGTFNVAGNYTAQSIADGAYCAVSMGGSHNTTSNPLPIAPAVSQPADVCQNAGDLVFTASGYTGTLEWVSNGGGAESGNTITFTSTSTGAKAVTARSSQTYTNAPVCYSAEVTKSATVLPLPAVAFYSGDARCGEGSLTLSASPFVGAVIDWYDAATGGNLLQSANNYYTTPSITNTTTYYAQARNTSTGCVSAARMPALATVNPVPAVPTMGGGGEQCGSLDITATPGSGGNGIRWTDNNSTASPRSVDATGTYYAVTTSAAGCESGQASVEVTILTAPFIAHSGGDATQTVNVGTAITPIYYTGYDATSIYLSTGGFPAGVTGSANGTVFTISGTPSVVNDNVKYSVVADNAYCSTDPVHGSIIVLGNPCYDCITWTQCEFTQMQLYYNEPTDWQSATDICAQTGMRLPHGEEMACLCDYQAPGEIIDTFEWGDRESGQQMAAAYRHIDCGRGYVNKTSQLKYRCVK
jgi:hypothetical protein